MWSVCVSLGWLLSCRIGLVHLEALASCANAKPLIISNPTVSKAEVSYCDSGATFVVISFFLCALLWLCNTRHRRPNFEFCASHGYIREYTYFAPGSRGPVSRKENKRHFPCQMSAALRTMSL